MKEIWADFVAGWLAGGAGLLVGHPLDTVKTRLQTMRYNGIINCVISTFRQETLSGFYKGMTAPFMTVGFMHAVLFTGYGGTLKYLDPEGKQHNIHNEPPYSHILLANYVGSVLQWIPSVPIEVIKIKLQIQKVNVGHIWESRHYHLTDNKLYSGPFHCAHRLINQYGLSRGLYVGGAIQLIRDLIGFSFYIPLYELLYRNLRGEDFRFKTPATLLAGGVAGVAGWVCILPLDVVKSRIQAQDLDQPQYRSAWHCAKITLEKEGYKAFFKGGSVMVIRAFPVNAVLFLVYARSLEFCKQSSW